MVKIKKINYYKYVFMFRHIEKYLIDVDKRTKEQNEIKKKKKEQKDKCYQYLVDNKISLMVSQII